MPEAVSCGSSSTRLSVLARVRAAAILGIDAYPVDVEVDLANGLPSFSTVGLPSNAVREARERVTAALLNSGFEFPLKRITANLAPADVPKGGTAFDLAIAIGILAASGQCDGGALSRGLVLGELGLEGALRPVRGALSLVACAKALGAEWVVLPAPNAGEGGLVDGVEVLAADSLRAVVDHFGGTRRLGRRVAAAPVREAGSAPDFAEVRGQSLPKRAIEITAAGGHNLLMVGPPGSGKTMLARRLPGIMPLLTHDESIEVTKIHSVAGLVSGDGRLIVERPFRAPHHTVSDAGMTGGGTHPRPGEVSLSHRGVLFLDELPEFRRNVLESLRQPVEDGVVTLSRAAFTVSYPARFMLVAAMNPCPCGQAGHPGRACTCSPDRVKGYRSRVSGPLLDRIDLQIEVPAVPWTDLGSLTAAEPSAAIRERVDQARQRQRARFGGQAFGTNAELRGGAIDRWCGADRDGRSLLGRAVERYALSARAYVRVLKVARTIADLEGSETVRGPHVAEAIRYRIAERVSEGAGRPAVGAGTPPD